MPNSSRFTKADLEAAYRLLVLRKQEQETILENLRRMMDDEDEKLVAQLAFRYYLATKILEVKRRLGIDLHSPVRERRILERVTRMGTDLGLPPHFIQMIYYQLLADPFRQFEPLQPCTPAAPAKT